MADKIWPNPWHLAIVFCDAIFRDPSTGKRTLLGCFSSIVSSTYPATARLAVHIALTDGYGKTPLTIRLVHADGEGDPVFEIKAEVDFPDPRIVGELDFTVGPATFSRPGEYRLQLEGRDNEMIVEKRLLVVDPTAESPNPEEGGPDEK